MEMERIDFVLALFNADNVQLRQHLDDNFQFDISDFSVLRGKRCLGTNFTMTQKMAVRKPPFYQE